MKDDNNKEIVNCLFCQIKFINFFEKSETNIYLKQFQSKKS